MGVFFNGIANVERTLGLDVADVGALPEGNAVHDVVRFVIHQFQFDVLLVASHHFAGSVVVDIMGAEHRFGIVGAKRVELLQVVTEFRGDVPEINLGIDVDYGAGLLRQDVPGHELFKTLGESGNIFHFHGQSGCIGVTAEVFQ